MRPTDAITTMPYCLWHTFIAQCATAPSPVYFAITTAVVTERVQLPFREAVHAEMNVISCVSPLFFNEKWQLNMLSIESYAYFGVTKQIYYYMSILENGMELLKVSYCCGFSGAVETPTPVSDLTWPRPVQFFSGVTGVDSNSGIGVDKLVLTESLHFLGLRRSRIHNPTTLGGAGHREWKRSKRVKIPKSSFRPHGLLSPVSGSRRVHHCSRCR